MVISEWSYVIHYKEAIAQAFAAEVTEHLHQMYDAILSSEVITLLLDAFMETFIKIP